MRTHLQTLAIGCLLLTGAAAPDAQSSAQQPPGIYLRATDAAGAERLIPIRATMLTDFKQKGTLKVMLTQGHSKPSLIGVVNGAAASVRAQGTPAFVFYFDADAGSHSPQDPSFAMALVTGVGLPPAARAAGDFCLVPLKASKDSKREAWFGTNNGSSGPGRSKEELAVTVEEIAPHAFRVQPKDALPPGEYGFYFAGPQGGMQVWDFGVDAK